MANVHGLADTRNVGGAGRNPNMMPFNIGGAFGGNQRTDNIPFLSKS